MRTEMTQIGELFRTQRQQKQLSLKEVENAISIRKNFLEAIEEGTIEQFLARVYVLGFMKQYAHYLDLDLEKILKEHPKAFTMPKTEYEFDYGIGTMEMRRSLGGGMKWLPNVLWSLGAVLVIVLAYYFSKALGIL